MKTLRLLRNLVALSPLRRKQSDSGILYDMSRMDDRTQWLVVNVSRQVWEAGLVKVGDHVLTPSMFEAKHTFTDGVEIVGVDLIKAVVHEG